MSNAGYLTQYASACGALATDYIVRSTRFAGNGVRILDARPQVYPFSVTIRHALEVASEAVDYHGAYRPGADDAVADSWEAYNALVAAQRQAELTRPETIDDLVAMVRQRSYAAIRDKTLLRTNPGRSLFTYPCAVCHGTGVGTCTTCAGTGNVACHYCWSTGRVTCHSCNGMNGTTVRVMVKDQNGYDHETFQFIRCSQCSGGKTTCLHCQGAGHQTCGSCHGSGKCACNACSGKGCLTRATSLHCYTQPSFSSHCPDGTPGYVAEALRKAGLANLSQHGTVALRDVVTEQGTSAAAFVYDCTMPFCQLAVELNGRPAPWVFFGTSPQILDAAGALEVLLREDAVQLRSLAVDGDHGHPSFHRSAAKTVAPFMASELNQEIVKASTEGLAPNAIYERVNRAVSESYIHNTLRNLTLTLQTTAKWAKLKWMPLFIVLSVPYVIGLTAWLHRHDYATMPAGAGKFYLSTGGGLFGIAWDMAWQALPFAFAGWLIARWSSARWVGQAGGKVLIRWARREGLLLGLRPALAMMAAAFVLTGVFFNRWPLWIDGQGKAYGMFALFNKPWHADPPERVAPAADPKHARKTRR